MKAFFRHSLSLLFFIVLAACSSFQTNKSDLAILGVKGKVKEIVSYWTFLEAGELAQGTISERARFNEDGNFEEMIAFDKLGNVTNREVTSYDEKGRKSHTEYHDEYGVYKTCYYSYDELGRLITCEFKDLMDRGIETLSINYDQFGNDTLRCTFNYSSNQTTYNRRTFDKDGKLMESSMYDAKNILLSRENYEYDSNGDLVRYLSYMVDEATTYELFFSYEDFDRKGNCGVTKMYDKDHHLTGGAFQTYEYY